VIPLGESIIESLVGTITQKHFRHVDRTRVCILQYNVVEGGDGDRAQLVDAKQCLEKSVVIVRVNTTAELLGTGHRRTPTAPGVLQQPQAALW
jgi:hypothetical protein